MMGMLTRRQAIRMGIVGTLGVGGVAVVTGRRSTTAADPAENPNLKCLGMVSVKSVHNAYLQAYTKGELHASNKKRNEEETWFLWEVEEKNKSYALQNYRTGAFLEFVKPVCAVASRSVISDTEKWTLIKGSDYGVVNAVAIQSLASKQFLGAHSPGENTECGGEVGCGDKVGPKKEGGWPCWWVLAGEKEKPVSGTPGWVKAFEDGLKKTVEFAPAVIENLLKKL